MENQSSFILIPRVYNPPCKAELHLVVVNDNGMKLGVIATAFTADGRRYLMCEAAGELQGFELAAVIERVKQEKAEGKIDKAFCFGMVHRAADVLAGCGSPELRGNLELFQFVQEDGLCCDCCKERDRIDGLLEAVLEDYAL